MEERQGIMTEESAPAQSITNEELNAMQRINQIRQGATPVVKPSKQSSPAMPPPPPAVSSSAQGQGAEIEELTSEFTGAVIRTNFGDISVDFYGAESPVTVNNFLNLAKKGFYNGTKFHRVIKDFMIQGGDPLSKDDAQKERWGTGGPGYKFQDEFNDRPLQRGSLAMANSGPNTNGSQFFIVTKEFTPWLDGKHTNFGQVTEGMDTVLKIEGTITGENDRPLEAVVINSIELIK